MYHKGKFTDIKHPDKYVGDIRNITYRSHWERNVMRWLDQNDNVIEWASEEVSIPCKVNNISRKNASTIYSGKQFPYLRRLVL